MVYRLAEGRWVYQCLHCGRHSDGTWEDRELAEHAERGHFIAMHEIEPISPAFPFDPTDSEADR